MSRGVKALVLLLVLPAGCASGPRGLSLGDFYFNRGWYWTAQKQYLAVARKDPKNILAWASAGLAASAREKDVQSYQILREGALANRDNLLLPLLASEAIGYGEGIPILMEQIADEQGRFASLAYDHALPGEILDPLLPTERSKAVLELESAPRRLEIMDKLQPKADAGTATAEELLILGMAHGTGKTPDRARAAEYLDRALKRLPHSVAGQYQRIFVKRLLAHRRLWEILKEKNPDRKAAQEVLKPVLAAVHEALVEVPDSYVPLLALRTGLHGPYFYEFYAPWARAAAKQHPNSACAQFLAAYAMASYSRLEGMSPKGWDARAAPYLKKAIKLSRGWKRPQEILEQLQRFEKLRPRMHSTARDFERE